MSPYKIRPICKTDGCATGAHRWGYCRRHHRLAVLAGETKPVMPSRAERFWAKVAIGDRDECWPWQAKISDQGYGYFGDRGAHRTAYELAKGPIPDGLQIDHLCFNRRCVNPNHLEAVTPSVNVKRGYGPSVVVAFRQELARSRTHCAKGHEFTPENTVTFEAHPLRKRCRTCERATKRARRAKAKACATDSGADRSAS